MQVKHRLYLISATTEPGDLGLYSSRDLVLSGGARSDTAVSDRKLWVLLRLSGFLSIFCGPVFELGFCDLVVEPGLMEKNVEETKIITNKNLHGLMVNICFVTSCSCLTDFSYF